MFDECLKALWVIGCTIAGEDGAGRDWTITFPGGERKTFSDTKFKLICYRVYNEVMAA